MAATNKTARERAVLVAVSLYVFSGILTGSTVARSLPTLPVEPMLTCARFLSIALILVSAVGFRDGIRKRLAAAAAASSSLLLLSAGRSGDWRLVIAFVLALTATEVPRERLCRAFGIGALSAIVVVMALALAGVARNEDCVPNGRLVFAYGLGHPNGLGFAIFSALAAIALSSRRGRSAAMGLSLAAAAFSYVALSSNASVAVNLMLFVSIVAVGCLQRLDMARIPKRIFLAVLLLLPAILLVGMAFLTVAGEAAEPMYSLANKLTHSRPLYAHEYLMENGGFSLLGGEYVIESHVHNGVGFNGIDSGYCYLPLVLGFATTAVLAAWYVVAVGRLSLERDVLVFCIVCTNLLYLVVEQGPFSLELGSAMLVVMSLSGESLGGRERYD